MMVLEMSSNRVINVTSNGATIDASGSGTLTLSGGVTGTNDNIVLTGTGDAVESAVTATGNGTVTKNEQVHGRFRLPIL